MSTEPATEPASGEKIPAPEAIMRAIAMTQQNSLNIDDSERAANGVDQTELVEGDADAPPSPRLPFPRPPFDSEKAFDRITSKNRAVHAARASMEKAQTRAKELKDDYLEKAKELDELITQFADDKFEAERAVQPRLVTEPSSPEKRLICQFEKETGDRCPICRQEGNVVNDPWTPEHYMAANQIISERLAGFDDLSERAVAAGWLLRPETIEHFTEAQQAELHGWLNSEAGLSKLPASLGTPHAADAPGESVQACQRCGSVLIDLMTSQAIALGTLVGIDCEARPEPARQIKPRQKKGGKK